MSSVEVHQYGVTCVPLPLFRTTTEERDHLREALERLDKQVHICGKNGYGVSDCPGCQIVRPALFERSKEE